MSPNKSRNRPFGFFNMLRPTKVIYENVERKNGHDRFYHQRSCFHYGTCNGTITAK